MHEILLQIQPEITPVKSTAEVELNYYPLPFSAQSDHLIMLTTAIGSLLT